MRSSKTALICLSAAVIMVGSMGLTGCTTNPSKVKTNSLDYTRNHITPNATYRNNMNPLNTGNTYGLDGRYGTTGTTDGRYGMGTDGRYGTYGVHPYGTNRANKMELSKVAADRVVKIPGVRTANVVMLGNDAYVAVVLKSTSAKGVGTGTRIGTNGYRGTGTTGIGTYGLRGAGTTGIGTDGYRGTYGTYGTGGNTSGIVNHMSSDMGLNTMHNRQSTHMGPYSNTTSGDQVSSAMKKKIAHAVKQAVPHTKNVYVSANVDFVSRVSGYADQVRAGHPIAGLTNEFTTMVGRLFPERVGTGGTVTPKMYRGNMTNTPGTYYNQDMNVPTTPSVRR